MKSFEQLVTKEVVENLNPDDLIIHTRHLFLLTAKDLFKSRFVDEREMAENSIDVVLNLQEALENFGPNFV